MSNSTAQPVVLHDYQQVAKDFIVTHPKSALFLDVGFGKTLITLTALQELASKNMISGHVLIIAPKAVARSTWIDEMKKWNICANTVSLLVNEKDKSLTKKKRYELYDAIATTPPSFYFINRDLIYDLVNYHVVNKKPWPFQTVVIDELHSFKSYASRRFKAMKAVSPYITRLIGLTGTPQPNGLEDLWAPIYLMDNGERLGKTITEYRTTYFNPGLVVKNVTVKWNPKPGSEALIYSKIKDLVMSVKNPSLKLPSVSHNEIRCHMSPDEMETYKSFMKEKILTDVVAGNEDAVVKASNAGVLSLKLSQMASGTAYIDGHDPKAQDYIVIHQRKLEHLEYVINNTNSPIIVAYHFKSEKDQIEKYLSAAGIDVQAFDGSPDMVHRWNAGEIQVMLIQPASAGCGINLQDGGHTLVWYTLPTSLEEYIQTCGRINRQGQKYPVVFHYLLVPGTIDARLLSNLQKKDMSERALIDAVSATFADVDDNSVF